MPTPPPADAGPVIDTVTTLNPEAPTNMDRQQMIDALQQLGYDTSLITDTVPDAALAEILRVYEANSAPAKGEPAPGGAAAPMADGEEEKPAGDAPPPDPNAQPVEQYEEDAPPTREELIAFLVQAGAGDEATLSALPDDQLQELFVQVAQAVEQQASAPAAPAAPPPAAAMGEKVKKMSERALIKSIVREVFKEFGKDIDQKVKAVTQQTSELEQNERRKNIRAFCESLRAEGKLLPAEFNATVARLFRAGTSKVHKFSEGGKAVAKSELDLQMAELRQRPILVAFSERLKQPVGTADAEVAQVESHFEKFSEQFKKTGMTKDKFVSVFRRQRERHPLLTAREFCAAN